nr:uracil-DNA glycosylase family protein [Halovenus carboxidivorans]
MDPPCERFVPGYGVTDADFHVIGDHPGVHGGLATGIPFTDMPWSERFFDALREGGLLPAADGDGRFDSVQTYFSYLHMCELDGERPDDASYADLEPYFDAELRAITAHVLLPVGKRATAHVFREYTAIDAATVETADLHATEQHGSGWLIVPIKEPATWTDEDERALVDRLRGLLASDYRQISDLGRFQPDGDPYFVR